MTISRLISGHNNFKESYDRQRAAWAKLIEEGQRPHALWIGCSDSRVIPEQITAARPGDLFVLRNIANVVPPYGTSGDASAAALEFAVQQLSVEHIIVCGHTICGGVGAVMDPGTVGATSQIARWVSWIQPALSQVEARGVDEANRYLEVVKANILLQCDHVKSYPMVDQTIRAGRLQVHGWLFDLESGDLMTFDDTTGVWQPLRTSTDSPDGEPE